MDSRIKEVESLLEGAQYLGIWGMAGIGKTALAENLFHKISTHFEVQCFINVRQELERLSLMNLRNEIVSQVLKLKGLVLDPLSTLPIAIRRKLGMKKFLVVLDDVNGHQQLEILAGRSIFFGPGSKIIVTSRDKHVLQNGCDRTYEVKRLATRQAFQLFTWNAFKQQSRPTELLIILSKRVVDYVDGIPLALKVLGSNLYGKSAEEWKSMLKKLEEIPDKEITEVLKLSYEALDRHEKRIFLDIACFFRGTEKDRVIRILDACDLYATSGLTTLHDKSLIDMSKKGVEMHDLLQKMGRNIVRQECIQDPGKRSRLWDPKDICRVMPKQMVSEKVEGIALDLSKSTEMRLSSTTFSRSHNLRLLRFYNPRPRKLKLHFPDGLEFLPEELRLLEWCQYPLKSFPSNFCPAKLVELYLPHSQVQQLWDPNQILVNVRIIRLSQSKNLTRIPDLLGVPNLEDLDLRGCSSLVEIPSSVGRLKMLTSLAIDDCTSLKSVPSEIRNLRNLSYLSLANCTKLCSFPNFLDLTKLEFLSLSGCPNLTELPEIPANLEVLDLGSTAIRELPSSIGCLSKLHRLYLHNCTELEVLPSSIGDLKCLQELTVYECSKLARIEDGICNLKSLDVFLVTCPGPHGLPENLGNLQSLSRLYIGGIGVRKLPSSIGRLDKLQTFVIEGCQNLILPPLTGFNSLKELQIIGCGITNIPLCLGSFSSLTQLHLTDENRLGSIPTSIKQLSRLQYLIIIGCQMLQSLPELPLNLQSLEVYYCTSLTSVPGLATKFNGGFRAGSSAQKRKSSFGNCLNLDDNACSKVLDDAQTEIQNLVTWLINKQSEEFESAEEEHESRRKSITGSFTLCVPGFKIPPWFEYQSIGPTLPVKADGGKHLDLRRVVYCAVVACRCPSIGYNIKCECELMTPSGDCVRLQYSYDEHPCMRDDFEDNVCLDLAETYHVLLWYHSQVFEELDFNFTEATFKFYPVDRGGESLLTCCEVVRCGVTVLENSRCDIKTTSGRKRKVTELESN